VAHNTRPILGDVNGKPIPQYFNAQQDQYEALLGQDGAARAVLYGPNGQPIGTAGNPLQVKAHDTDAVLDQIKDALGPLATETRLEAVRILVEDLKSELNLVKSELQTIKANQLSGDQKVQLSGTIFGADISDRPSANSVPVGTIFVITNAKLDAWISNGTDWVVI
jgi:hypothetical protein